jgi:hypothetical protein
MYWAGVRDREALVILVVVHCFWSPLKQMPDHRQRPAQCGWAVAGGLQLSPFSGLQASQH